MDKYDIKKLRELPIEAVAERLGMQVERHKALCPFHDDRHPSLSFSVSRNTYKCFVCEAHGGTIDLAMKMLNKPFLEACQWLAGENAIVHEFKGASPQEFKAKPFDAAKYAPYFEHPFLNELATDFLFAKRRLDPRVTRWCRLTSWQEWLQIPYFDIDNRLTGIQWRYLGTDKSQPRFRFPYGSQCHIYNQPVLRRLRPDEPLYITEGASDCWSMLSAGHKAIAIPSATLLSSSDAQTLALAPSKDWHIYPDADVPGEKLYNRLLALATQLGACLTRHSLPEGCKDYSEYYVKKMRN